MLPDRSLTILITGIIALTAAALIWIAARMAPLGIEYKAWLKLSRRYRKAQRTLASLLPASLR